MTAIFYLSSLAIPFFADLDPKRFIMGHAKNKSIPSISRCSNKLLSLWYIIELSLLVEIAQSGVFLLRQEDFCQSYGSISCLTYPVSSGSGK